MYKVSIDCWDIITLEFIGWKEYFESYDDAIEYFRKSVIEYLEFEAEIYLVDCDNNDVISEFRAVARN